MSNIKKTSNLKWVIRCHKPVIWIIHLTATSIGDSREISPSWELIYPPKKALLKIIFLFPRWNMLAPVQLQVVPFCYCIPFLAPLVWEGIHMDSFKRNQVRRTTSLILIQTLDQCLKQYQKFLGGFQSPFNQNVSQVVSWSLTTTSVSTKRLSTNHPTTTTTTFTSWWFQPIWKILVKLGIFPK